MAETHIPEQRPCEQGTSEQPSEGGSIEPPRPGPTIRALVATESHVLREGLRGLLSGSHVQIVGTCELAGEAAVLAHDLRAGVVFLGGSLLQSEGPDVLTGLASLWPGTATIVLGEHNDAGLLSGCLQRGACCYLSQNLTRQTLLMAADAAARGYTLVDRETLKAALYGVTDQVDGTEAGDVHLTARERDVLGLVCQGLTNGEIAEHLVVSVGTVRTHVSNILGKLGVPDRTRAAVWAAEHGWQAAAPGPTLRGAAPERRATPTILAPAALRPGGVMGEPPR